jgi:RNA polymerase sigma-70 factor (ECF subfamily)
LVRIRDANDHEAWCRFVDIYGPVLYQYARRQGLQDALSRAAEQIRGTLAEATWQAFWQTAVEAGSAKDVARSLGISVGAVYVAKSRVAARIRQEVQKLEAS